MGRPRSWKWERGPLDSALNLKGAGSQPLCLDIVAAGVGLALVAVGVGLVAGGRQRPKAVFEVVYPRGGSHHLCVAAAASH